MATVIAYQRLLEVRFLHEYYLLSREVLSYFDKPEDERYDILRKRVSDGHYLVREDILIEPTPQTQAALKGLGWRFIRSSAGFTLAAATEPMVLSNGQAAKRPKVAPAPGTQFQFVLRTANPLFQNFTTVPLRRQRLPYIYYFNNRPQAVNEADFASMSLPVPVFSPDRFYEMGDLAMNGNLLQEADTNISPPATGTWTTVKGSGFVNEADRTCLPKNFSYPLDPGLNIHHALVTLLDGTGNEVNRLMFESKDKPLSEMRLQWSTPRSPLPDGRYQVQINAGAVSEILDVFLSDAHGGAFGIIHLNMDEQDPRYRILGTEGEIRSTPGPNGRPLPPVFELRWRSRKTYWQYLPHFTGKTFKPESAFDKYLNEHATTFVPQPFTFLPIGVMSPTENTPALLPKAEPALLKPRPPDRLSAEIRIFKIPGLAEV